MDYDGFVDPIKAEEKYFIFVEYAKKYYGTKKEYKDYHAAARTFQSKIREFENYKRPAIVNSKTEICTSWESMTELFRKNLKGVHIGKLLQHLKTQDQNGGFDNWGYDRIYQLGLKKSENFRQGADLK